MNDFEKVVLVLGVYLLGALIAGAGAYGVIVGNCTVGEAFLVTLFLGLFFAFVGFWAIQPYGGASE